MNYKLNIFLNYYNYYKSNININVSNAKYLGY